MFNGISAFTSTVNKRNALLLGIQYLAFQAFPIIFEKNHGFDVQSTGLSFLGIGVGMIMAISTQPYWNRQVFLQRFIPATARCMS